MNAIRAIERRLTPEILQQMQRDYHFAAQPIIGLMADIISLSIPRMLIKPNGEIEHQHIYTETQQVQMQQCEKMLSDLRQSIFGDLAVTAPTAQDGDGLGADDSRKPPKPT